METHDKDGKATTSSAVDSAHYPDPHDSHVDGSAGIDHHTIAELAFSLWVKRGCPIGTADQDWAEAEKMLHSAEIGRSAIRHVESEGGSVQA